MDGLFVYSAVAGQRVTLVAQTVDGYSGARVDGYMPNVQQILFPSLDAAAGFPQNMTRVDVGLYAFTFQIPNGIDSLGTFITSIYFVEPGTLKQVWQTHVINVARPFGNISATPI